MAKKRSRGKKLTEEQKKQLAQKKKEAAFKRKIRNTFIDSGFTYFSTANKEFKIGNRVVELDYMFIYENIIVICEDTCAKKKDKDHIRKKSESAREIANNIETLLEWTKNKFPEKLSIIEKYRKERFYLFYIYISQAKLELTTDEKKMYSNIVFWEPEILAYFNRMSQCIHYSARYEIFRFLGLKNENIGYSKSEETQTTIKAPIIYPEDTTGINTGIRVVSFMMSAEKLLKTAYVLRKDSWEDSMFLYQRLIEKDKIKKIRQFLANKGETFYNNIIVALPDNIKFEDDSGHEVSIEDIGDFQHCKLVIPEEMNSICVIDGQHRIFSHYEAPANEKYEEKIAQLRGQLHMLVTGLIFPDKMKPAERKQVQSEIFLEINDNTKKVAPNVLLHIEMLKNPFSDLGLAKRVIEKLNKESTFLNCFELSSLDEDRIKVASIIKFALRYLVTSSPAEGKHSLYEFWSGDKKAFVEKEEDALMDYIFFCTKKIDMYFSAVKNVFKNEWYNCESKLLSVISLNGFIIAFTRQFSKNSLGDYGFYYNCFQKLNIDFSKENFPYTSSQYKKFSDKILMEAFDFTPEEISIV